MRFTLIDPEHPFYAPLWRRVAIVAVTLLWTLFEFAAGSATWGMIVGALCAYSAYKLLLAFTPHEPGDKGE